MFQIRKLFCCIFSITMALAQEPISENSKLKNPTVKWNLNLGEPKSHFFEQAAGWPISMTLANNSLLIGINSNLVSIDRLTGKEEWRFNSDGYRHLPPVFDSNFVFFFTSDNFIFSIDRNNGKQVWKKKIPFHLGKGDDVFQSLPTIDANHLLFGYTKTGLFDNSPGKTLCINPATGETIWEEDIPYGLKPFLSDGNLFTGINKDYYSINVSTGKTKWKSTIDKIYHGHAERMGDYLLICGGNTLEHNNKNLSYGTLQCTNINDGKLLWKYAIGAPNNFTVSGNMVLTKKSSFWGDKLCFFEIESGKLTWETNIAEFITAGWTPKIAILFNQSILLNTTTLNWVNPFEKSVIGNNKFQGKICSEVITNGNNTYFIVNEIPYTRKNTYKYYLSMYKTNNTEHTISKIHTFESIYNGAELAVFENNIYALTQDGKLLAIEQ